MNKEQIRKIIKSTVSISLVLILTVISVIGEDVHADTIMTSSPTVTRIDTLAPYSADSTYIYGGGKIAIIDLGDDSNSNKTYGTTVANLYNKTAFKKAYTIDYLIITHLHVDHTNALKYLADKANKEKKLVTIKNLYINAIDFKKSGPQYNGIKALLKSEYIKITNLHIVGLYGKVKSSADASEVGTMEYYYNTTVNNNIKNEKKEYHNYDSIKNKKEVKINVTYVNKITSVKLGSYKLCIFPALQKYAKKQDFMYEISPDSTKSTKYWNSMESYFTQLKKDYIAGECDITEAEIKSKLLSLQVKDASETAGVVGLSFRVKNAFAKSMCAELKKGSSVATAMNNSVKEAITDSRIENNHCMFVTYSDDENKSFKTILGADLQAISMKGIINHKDYVKYLVSYNYGKCYYKVAHHGCRVDNNFGKVYDDQSIYFSELYNTELEWVNYIQPTAVAGTHWKGGTENDIKNYNLYLNFRNRGFYLGRNSQYSLLKSF